MAWRLAAAVAALRSDVNARWPGRDKASDGTIGDAAHATRASDHNPWINVAGVGVVRALDIDVDGIDAGWYAEQLRKMGQAGDHRLTDGGYVIFNRSITSADFSRWVTYTGTNPHTSHVHVSVSRLRAGFDDESRWLFLTKKTTQGGPDVDLNDTGIPYPYRETGDQNMTVARALGFASYIPADMAKDDAGRQATTFVNGSNRVSIPALRDDVDDLRVKVDELTELVRQFTARGETP